MPDVPVRIFHNPACGTSRNMLGLIRNAGVEPEIIEYFTSPLTRDELRALVARMAIPLRYLLRERGTPFRRTGTRRSIADG